MANKIKSAVLISTLLVGMLPGISAGAVNPYLPLWEHLPDGEPRVFEDPDNPGKYRVYIIGSHDVRYDSYCGPDIRIWSAPTHDLTNWRDEGPVFTYQIEGRWDVMYAPDLVEVKRKDGTKEYYLYPHSRGPNREAMVAKGPTPVGPFTPINLTADGRRTVSGSILGFDPAVYIDYITDPNDPDYEIGFRAYGYWGFMRSFAAELDQNTMYSLRPGTEIIEYFIPASTSYGVLNDPEGTTYPHVYAGEDLNAFNFFEAASIRKIGNKYIWVYSGYSGPDYGLGSSNSTLRYAFGDTPLGPWKSGGVLVDSRAVVVNKDGTKLETSYSGHNTHGSIEFINDQWYVFYHRAPRGFGYARQAMVAPIHVTWDEKLVVEGGRVTIRGFDPYAEDNIWTAEAGGFKYTGAEVTSEGFSIYGLDPYQYYSAGIACYLSNHGLQADAFDIWNDHAPITNIKSNDIIGYKYFGFGGLAEDKKGLKAFAGTAPGNNTYFSVFLFPKTQAAFSIEVWLDGPWDNDTWNGKQIGIIEVPGSLDFDVHEFSVDISEHVDHLDGKHAIYLIAKTGVGASFDLIGLGMGSDQKKLVRPTTPTFQIMVDGKEVAFPTTPIRSTYENGIVGYDLYELEIPRRKDEAVPAVTAHTDYSDLKITINEPKAIYSPAVIELDYLGVVKTLTISFVVDDGKKPVAEEKAETPAEEDITLEVEEEFTEPEAEETTETPQKKPIGKIIGLAMIAVGAAAFTVAWLKKRKK